MKLNELEIYNLSMELGDKVWNIVIQWDYFNKNSLGLQFIRAADSIAANISEGFGRLSPKDNRRFCLISRGSLYESTTWLVKAYKRNLIGKDEFEQLLSNSNNIKVKLWNYIKALEKSI